MSTRSPGRLRITPDQLTASARVLHRYCFTLNFGHAVGASLHSRNVPRTAVSICSNLMKVRAALFKHLIGAGKEQGRNGKPDRFRGPEVDCQREFRWMPNWKFTSSRTLHDLVDTGGGAAYEFYPHGSVGKKRRVRPGGGHPYYVRNSGQPLING